MEKIKIFPEGEGKNELGIRTNSLDNSPKAIFIGSDGQFLISDFKNKRLIFYNKKLDYINEITDKKIFLYVVDYYEKRDNLLLCYTFQTLSAFNMDSMVLKYNISLGNFRKYVRGYGFRNNSIINFNNLILFYRRDKQIVSIIHPSMDPETNKQNFRGPEETRKIIKEKQLPGLENLSIDDKDRLFVNGELVTKDFDVFVEYWNEKHKKLKEKASKLNITVNPESHFGGRLFNLGKDAAGNYYWGDGVRILVFNKDGFLIDYFKGTNGDSITIPALHPCGDIYFIGPKYGTEKVKTNDKYHGEREEYPVIGAYLYRVKNVWDPKGRAKWYRESGVKDLQPISQGPGNQTAMVTADGLRVRKSSSLNATVVGNLKKGDSVEILRRGVSKVTINGISDYWYKIRRSSDGLEGWCFGGYLRLEGN